MPAERFPSAKPEPCFNCGSTNLVREAFAVYDEDAGEWVLHSVYDEIICDDCGNEQ